MGLVTYWGSQILLLAVVGLLFVAVTWEAFHLVDWANTLSSGSASSYLRHHAYTYVTWFFGTSFGWEVQ